eukprot:jgi/Mesen1/61/ME1105423C05702
MWRRQCVRARHDAASHDRRSFQVDLQYPAGRAAAVAGGVSFCEVLERSLGASEDHPVDDVPADATVYELTAMIAHIYDFADAPEEEEEDEGDQQQLYDGHLVAHIKVPAGDGPAAHSGTLSPRLPHHARHLQHQVAPHRTATHAGSPRSAPPRVLPGMEHLIVEGSTA